MTTTRITEVPGALPLSAGPDPGAPAARPRVTTLRRQHVSAAAWLLAIAVAGLVGLLADAIAQGLALVIAGGVR